MGEDHSPRTVVGNLGLHSIERDQAPVVVERLHVVVEQHNVGKRAPWPTSTNLKCFVGRQLPSSRSVDVVGGRVTNTEIAVVGGWISERVRFG